MADSIRIDSGVKRIMINDDPSRVIEFNPKDVIFAEKFYGLVADFKGKQDDFIARAEALEAVIETDELGLPINTGERIQLVREVCEWAKDKIDSVFGAGTSQKVFGDAVSIPMFTQFFEGITPFIEEVRGDQVQKYSKVVADRKKIEESKAVMD
jgi:hypothetical protein